MLKEKPYIEYEGKKYEFDTNFDLRRKYSKETQRKMIEVYSNNSISEAQIKKVKEIQNQIEKGLITEKTLSENEELKKEILSLQNLANEIDLVEINYEFCYLMLKNKYNMEREYFEEIIATFTEDYGSEVVDDLMTQICSIVFPSKEVNKEKTTTLPNWYKEKK